MYGEFFVWIIEAEGTNDILFFWNTCSAFKSVVNGGLQLYPDNMNLK